MANEKFDALAPFANKKFLAEVLKEFEGFEYKLYGPKPIKLYRGKPTEFEFDLNLEMIHFTEKDFQGISEFVRKINDKWGTSITYCIYPAKERNRDMIINVRSPKAPMETD